MAVIIQRALISVSDKTDIVSFAKSLHQFGVEILSTGGTATVLKAEGIPVQEVSELTGFPEIMEGRVKTLHPKVHGGILGRRDIDAQVMSEHDIPDIDLVVVNLYPFEKTISNPDHSLDDAIEHIDIGGPALIRAAAKNHDWVTVAVDPKDYRRIQTMLLEKGEIDQPLRYELAAKAFAHTSEYDGMIANYLGQHDETGQKQDIGTYLHCHFTLGKQLRYGENPQQMAAFYREKHSHASTLAHAEHIQGKALSFNNLVDAETALLCCYGLERPACVIVKHANPCGVGEAQTLGKAYEKAFACDPTSSFGGIIALNRTVDKPLIEQIFKNQFVEVIVAPMFTKEAIEQAQRKPKVTLLSTGTNQCVYESSLPDLKRLRGGVLYQSWDNKPLSLEDCKVVTKRPPSEQLWDDLLFTWHVCRFVKSNAIVFGKEGQTLGIGAGQMSRVFSVEIAHHKAQQAEFDLKGSVVASEAFFPFADGVELAAQYGVKAVIQPGGSIRDEQVIQACDNLGLAMVFTGTRHFKH